MILRTLGSYGKRWVYEASAKRCDRLEKREERIKKKLGRMEARGTQRRAVKRRVRSGPEKKGVFMGYLFYARGTARTEPMRQDRLFQIRATGIWNLLQE